MPRRMIVALAISIAGAGTLAGQTAPAPQPTKPDTVVLEAFTVTGSNVKRVDAEQTLPVTAVTRESIDLSGGTTAIQFFQSLPYIGAIVLNETDAKSSVGARGDVAFINLRSLPSGNTLVLTNGRRMVPHGIAQATDGATGSGVGAPALSVNTSTLAQAAIERIEVLRDGASAVYGSDASAGVVNNIMLRKQEGWTLRARYGNSFKNDFYQSNLSINGGTTFNQGKSNVSLTFDFYNRDGLQRKERDYAQTADLRGRTPAPWDGVAVAGVTNSVQQKAGPVGYIFRLGGITTGARPAGNVGISTTANNTQTMTVATSGQFWILPGANGGAPTIMNSAPSATNPDHARYFSATYLEDHTIFPKAKRFNFFATVDHELSDSVQLYGDLGLYNSETNFIRWSNTITSSLDNPFAVGVDNPYNPFGSRFYHPTGAPNADGTPRLTGTPQQVFISSRPTYDLGPIHSRVNNEAYRALLGLKGKIKGSTWSWDSGILYSENQVTDRNVKGLLQISKLREAMARSGADAYNPFGATFGIGPDNLLRVTGPYTNPRSVIDFIQPATAQPARHGETSLFLVDAKANGELFTLPSGPIALAAGAEFRYETYLNDRDPFFGTNPANAGAFFNSPTSSAADYVGEVSDIRIDSDRQVTSAFAELVLPVFGDRWSFPLMKRLELTAAGRMEHFDQLGTVTKPKYGALWVPVDWLKIRGAYSESFLAPNMAQTYPGYLYRFANGITDPYRFDVTGILTTDGPNTFGRLALRGGGQSLQPERSTNTNYGFVLSPPWIKGLGITVDFWSLKQRDAISSLGAAVLLQRDQALLQAFVQSELAAGKTISQIDLGSGTANYKGLSLVSRAPISPDDAAAFAAYNATRPQSQQRAPVGPVTQIVDAFLNLSARNIEGVDFEVEYRIPRRFSFGSLRLNAMAAYQSKYEVRADPTRAMVDYRWANFDQIPIPLWRGNATVNWTSPSGAMSAGLNADFISTWQDTRLTTTDAVKQALGNPDYISSRNFYIVPEQWYFNAFGSYRFKGGETGVGSWLKDTSVRVGINNLFDKAAPVTGSILIFESATGSRALEGRTFYVEFRKKL